MGWTSTKMDDESGMWLVFDTGIPILTAYAPPDRQADTPVTIGWHGTSCATAMAKIMAHLAAEHLDGRPFREEARPALRVASYGDEKHVELIPLAPPNDTAGILATLAGRADSPLARPDARMVRLEMTRTGAQPGVYLFGLWGRIDLRAEMAARIPHGNLGFLLPPDLIDRLEAPVAAFVAAHHLHAPDPGDLRLMLRETAETFGIPRATLMSGA